MTPFLRLSLSLSLTLFVWGPNAIDEFGNGSVNLGDLALRFVVTFAFFRASIWGVGRLLDTYRASVPASKDVMPAAPPSRAPVIDAQMNRRAKDPESNASAERGQPGLPAGRSR
jgi:hypothetical protein